MGSLGSIALTDNHTGVKVGCDVFTGIVRSQHCPQLHRLGRCDRRPISGRSCEAGPRAEALRPLLLPHAFRFVGLAFLIPGVVSPELPAAWARPAAYGDVVAALLALLALAGLKSRPGLALVWVFNLWGAADLLYGFYLGNAVGLDPGHLGAGYFIVTVLVPLLLITHALVFWLLLRGETAARAHTART